MGEYQARLERDYVEHLPTTDAATPFGLMRFRLTYGGTLPPSGNRNNNPDIKWKIRQQISPQLADLYETHPVLSKLSNQVHWLREEHPSGRKNLLEIAREPIRKLDCEFIPLVRTSLNLMCSLDITFLRRQPPGNLIKGGDIDARLKTLFDGLKVPTQSDIKSGRPDTNPFFCLMEDDSLITGVSVQTDRLLGDKSGDEFMALVLTDVTVRVMHIDAFNQAFLGD